MRVLRLILMIFIFLVVIIIVQNFTVYVWIVLRYMLYPVQHYIDLIFAIFAVFLAPIMALIYGAAVVFSASISQDKKVGTWILFGIFIACEVILIVFGFWETYMIKLDYIIFKVIAMIITCIGLIYVGAKDKISEYTQSWKFM
jgi:hypothetical protein